MRSVVPNKAINVFQSIPALLQEAVIQMIQVLVRQQNNVALMLMEITTVQSVALVTPKMLLHVMLVWVFIVVQTLFSVLSEINVHVILLFLDNALLTSSVVQDKEVFALLLVSVQIIVMLTLVDQMKHVVDHKTSNVFLLVNVDVNQLDTVLRDRNVVRIVDVTQ